MTGTALQIIAWLGRFVGKDTKFTITEAKEKRSLQANSYYWVLAGKVAQKTRISTARIHNENLRAMSIPEEAGGKIVTVLIPDTDKAENDVLESTTYHLLPTSETVTNSKGTVYRVYKMLRGSHTFDVSEMSALIDLMVQEADAQGIETITEAEKQRMLERYGVQIQKKQSNGYSEEG